MNKAPQNNLLDRIDSPSDLRQLKQAQLPQLAQEIRDYLINTISATGGHLAPGLGAVELTLALHYVFDTPHDRLVWDIGNQASSHKILTCRKRQLRTVAEHSGLAGLLGRTRRDYDVLGACSSSTSVGAALGVAVASRRDKQE